MKSTNNIIKLILIAYIATVILVSVMPFGGTSASLNKVTVLSFRLDYLLHALVFIPLVPVWRIAFPKHPWHIIIPAAILMAILAEVVHYYIPYRTYNVNDLVGNVAGAIIGIAPALVINWFKNRRRTPIGHPW